VKAIDAPGKTGAYYAVNNEKLNGTSAHWKLNDAWYCAEKEGSMRKIAVANRQAT
jgi:hypothetical protein